MSHLPPDFLAQKRRNYMKMLAETARRRAISLFFVQFLREILLIVSAQEVTH